MNKKLIKNNKVFSYYLPHKELYPYISYYSIQYKSFSTIAPLFIPDLGGSIIVSRRQNDFDILLWGPYSRITAIENRPNDVLAHYFIEFQPGGLSRLVYQNINEILNRQILLKEIDTNIYLSLGQIFEKHTNSEEALISSLDNYFKSVLDKRKDILANGRSILSFLQDFGINKTMNDLSNDVHYSNRHINRYLNALTGVSGKTYIRIKRFNKAVEMLKKSNSSIEQIAYRLGYFDAAHFVHDFLNLSGLSPALFRKNKPDFYNDKLKKI